MRLAVFGAVAALLAIPALAVAYSGPTAVKSGPPVIPYLCDGGRSASVVYESGSDFRHAKALVTLEGRTVELVAAPTLYGVRYRSDGGAPALAWTLRGEEAWLTEAPEEDSYTGDERPLARCVRVRGAAPAAEVHGDDH